MSVTLKQYLKAYQSARQLASPTSTSTLQCEPGQELEKAFNQKVKDLKRNLRKYLEDEEAFSLFESEIDELNNLFHQNSNLSSMSKISKGINEKTSKMTSHTRISKSKRKSNRIIAPRISLEDQMIDDVDENVTKDRQKKLRVETEPTEIYYKTISSIPNLELSRANFENHPPEITPSPPVLHIIHAKGHQEPKKIELSEILRSSLKTQISNDNINNWFNNKEKLLVSPPPQLDKKNSYDEEDIRCTNRSNFIILESQSFI